MAAITETIQTIDMSSAVALVLNRGFWRVRRSSLEWMSDTHWAKLERLPSGRVNIKIGIAS